MISEESNMSESISDCSMIDTHSSVIIIRAFPPFLTIIPEKARFVHVFCPVIYSFPAMPLWRPHNRKNKEAHGRSAAFFHAPSQQSKRYRRFWHNKPLFGLLSFDPTLHLFSHFHN